MTKYYLPDNYTLYGSNQFHKKISEHMKIIADRVLNALGEIHVEALVLMGGYGRGEGTVLIENETVVKIR